MTGKIVRTTIVAMLLIIVCSFSVYADKITDQPYSYYYHGNIENTFDYDDAWFEGSACDYNHQLAENSLKLASSAFGYFEEKKDYSKNFQNVEAFMTSLGMSGIYHNKQYELQPEANSVGCGIGYKKLSENVTLIAVAIRGAGYTNEWAGNFNIGNSNKDHEGFSLARDIVIDELKTYIKNNGISGRVKFWVSGYSRAGAVANLTAAWLDDNAAELGIECSKEDVFAYCFEAPMSTTAEDAHDDKYGNIYTISDVGDLITRIPCREWGFTSYGHTGSIGYEETEYVEAGINGVVNILLGLADSREIYYNNFQPVFMEEIQAIMGPEGKGAKSMVSLLLRIYSAGLEVYGEDFLKERNISLNSFLDYADQLVDIFPKHAPGRMMACFEKYEGRILFDGEKTPEQESESVTETEIETEIDTEIVTETEKETENSTEIETEADTEETFVIESIIERETQPQAESNQTEPNQTEPTNAETTNAETTNAETTTAKTESSNGLAMIFIIVIVAVVMAGVIIVLLLVKGKRKNH